MPKVKQLGLSDTEEIKRLFKDIFTKAPWNDDWSDESQLHNYILDLTGNRNSFAFGLYEGDGLIGLSLGSIIHWYEGTEYYIFEFCIKTELQGKGYGTFFLGKVEEFVKEKGIDHIFLQTERTFPAYEFYLKNGFTDMKEHVSLFKKF